MRSVIQTPIFSDERRKFNSGCGDKTFTIIHGKTTFVVDASGNVITPEGVPLDYTHEDPMKGNQSGRAGKVRQFLTVDPEMDTPGSKIW